MPITITDQETSALYGMLAEGGPDIILKIDAGGHIVESSPALARLVGQSGAANGIETLADLVEPSHLARVATALAEAVAGRESGWVEFPAVTTDARESWFEIRCRALHRNDGKAWGALAILRSVDERRALRDQLFAATYSDALTGLSNRRAFVSMLEHMLTRGIEGCVALFGIDFFKAINMRYGQARGDDVLCTFADLLRETLREEDVISRIGSERFAVLLPRTTPEAARAICARVVSTLSERHEVLGTDGLRLTASGGVVRIAQSLDSTLERAEMALFSARAKGRNRLEPERELHRQTN